ncbi:MAG: SDR family oxidoreductase [Qingshengfaniella sp.]
MTGKVLFITGASSGIGAATARAAAKAGWKLGLMARSGDALAEQAETLGSPQVACPLPGDVTDPAQVERALHATTTAFGQIDAVFANAGRGSRHHGTEGGDIADWRGMVDLNIMAVLYTAKAALPHLRQTRGHFLVTGSMAGRMHLKGSIYGATKWFIHGFAGNLADEMAEWGGRCTLISPGMVDTPFFNTPKPDKLQPEDIARAVMAALDQDPRACVREIYVTPVN